MKINFLQHKKKSFLKSKWFWLVLTGIIVLTVVGVVFGQKSAIEEVAEVTKKEVTVVDLAELTSQRNKIEMSGVVKADSKVDVVAMVSGQAKRINFEVGDEVSQNQFLAEIYDSVVIANFNTAQANYNSYLQNLNSTENLADQTITQAEIGIKSARESVRLSEIALESAQNSYQNALSLQQENNKNTRNNALVSYSDALSTSLTSLKQIDYLLGVDEDQMEGVSAVLGAKNSLKVAEAEKNYKKTKTIYQKALAQNPTLKSIDNDIDLVVATLDNLSKTVVSVIDVLNNTVTSSSFPKTSLDLQKASFDSLRTLVNQTLLQLQAVQQNLQNLDLRNKQELDSLQAVVDNANKQLEMAKLSLANAESGLSSASQAKNQQLVGASSSLNSASSQLSLYASQMDDLILEAPVRGIITAKNIELGSEVSIGQKVAEISQNDMVKIEVDMSADEVSKIKVGQEVLIMGEYKGTIANIAPTADPATRKIKTKIIFDNQGKELIPETFVDLEIELAEQIGSSVWLPLEAVNVTQNDNYIFVCQNGKAWKKIISIGQLEGGQVKITSGLVGDETIVIVGAREIKDGEEIICKK